MAAAIGVIVVVAVLIILSGLKVVKEYERGVVFRLGRLTPYRGPGVIFVIPIVERWVRIDLRTVTLDIPVPSQNLIHAKSDILSHPRPGPW